MPRTKHEVGIFAGWVSVGVNLLLFGLKIALGVMTGSIALVADAVHTLADSLTSLVLVMGSYIATRPPDVEHPFGHGRAETVSSLVIAVLLATAGVEFGKASLERVLNPASLHATWWIVAVVAGTAPIKEILARFSLRLGRDYNHQALEADGWHHRSDAIATLMVAGGMSAEILGFRGVDGWIGICVSLFIVKIAVDVGRRAIDSLLGTPPEEEEVDEIKNIAMSVPGVLGVHEITIHHYGDTRYVSLHLEVPPDMTAMNLHTMVHKVEDRISTGKTARAVVHIDPVNANHPRLGEVRDLVDKILDGSGGKYKLKKIGMLGSSLEMNVICHISVESGDKNILMGELLHGLKQNYQDTRLSVVFDEEQENRE
ncbi:MAG: cation transporter [Deltaproteobacteria bacterium]|nr:cation transporter [Deltaproteobacteria bacterium]